jgi:hypothetical protein
MFKESECRCVPVKENLTFSDAQTKNGIRVSLRHRKRMGKTWVYYAYLWWDTQGKEGNLLSICEFRVYGRAVADIMISEATMKLPMFWGCLPFHLKKRIRKRAKK